MHETGSPVDKGSGVIRLLTLQGGRNFRDLGGYPTRDGRRVRWGRLYRSGVLAYLTQSDQEHLDTLGIRVVCDFRNAHERSREAVRWTRSDLEILSWDYDPTLVSLRGILGSEELTPATGRSAMIRLYRALPSFSPHPIPGSLRAWLPATCRSFLRAPRARTVRVWQRPWCWRASVLPATSCSRISGSPTRRSIWSAS